VGFLIDSGIWIEVERGRLAVADVHAATRNQPVFISPVTIAELQLGAELIQDRTTRLKCLAFLRRLKRKPLLRIDAQTGEVFGSLAAQLHRSGRGHQFRVQDLWLAAQAVQRRFKLLTLNARDFKDIPGLELVVMKLPGA
jgi:predicted nucleic acid-binding protein